MEDKKLRNRNVCEEHFRIKMFMNIRKERLVRFAYPTLLKTNVNGNVYDLEKMKNCMEIGDLSVNSVLDDYYDDFLVEEADNPTLVGLQQPAVDVKDSLPSFTLNEQNIADIPVEFHTEREPSDNEIVKVLPNKIILTPVRKKVFKRPAVPESDEILTPRVTHTWVVPAKQRKTEVKTVKILNSSNLMKTIPTEPVEIQSTITSTRNTTKQVKQTSITPEKIPQQQKENLERMKKLTDERDQAITNEQKAKQELQVSQSKISVLESKVQELENKLKLAVANKSKPAKTITRSIQTDPQPQIVPKVSTSSPTQAPTKPGTLSKPQLFNGIKRYLSNAMATLLKMEMFGKSDREWKADEKKISCEVMRLGKEVYEYFTDEWRLRLPSKSEVNTWLQDSADDEDEDIF